MNWVKLILFIFSVKDFLKDWTECRKNCDF